MMFGFEFWKMKKWRNGLVETLIIGFESTNVRKLGCGLIMLRVGYGMQVCSGGCSSRARQAGQGCGM